ncbi:MAG: ABC transporter permease, partial [Anaerolineales bacterium]
HDGWLENSCRGAGRVSSTTTERRSFRWPLELQIEPRMDSPRWLAPLVSLVAVLLALVMGAVVLALVGGNPFRAYAHIAGAAFGSLGVFSDTLVKATPLIFTGTACAVAFKMKLWNIGAEGQFFMGALGASIVILAGVVSEDASRVVTLAVMAVAGAMFGAAWGFIPGILKARLGVNEIITTLMLNYIAFALVNYFIFGVWSEGGFQMTRTFQRAAWLPRLSDLAEQFPIMRGLTTHAGFILAVVVAIIAWYILFRSLWGYEIRLIGDNPRAAKYAGIKITRNTVLVLMLSGGIAGMGGMSEIAGVIHRLQGSISPGYGFTGIIIAWLAKLNPLLVIPVSILFGGLILAGREIQPSGVPRLIQGIILFMLIASEVFLRYHVRLVRRTA